MSYYEYRVVPAPKEIPKVKGVRESSARFALAMEAALNEEGAAGWEFQRSETQVVEMRGGLFRKSVVETVTVHVYRRWVDTVAPHESADWQQQLQDDVRAPKEPTRPNVSGAPISDRNTSDQRRPRQTLSLSAQRRHEGQLRPVPGTVRD